MAESDDTTLPTPDEVAELLHADFQAWMLRFRHMAGRPLSAEEHALTKVAHSTGFMAGFNCGAEVMRECANAR